MSQQGKSYKGLVILFWMFFSSPVIALIVILSLIAGGKMGFMPSFEDLENPQSFIASDVMSEDGVLLGKYYLENRSTIDFDDLSPNLVKAIVAIEDIRFEKHSGIDFRGLGRVLVKTILMGQEDAGGGSTITQQLAKNLFGRDTTRYKSELKRKMSLGVTKFKEWVTAVRLERSYTKKEIMVMYFNTVFFGSNAYGIKSAARTFFNKTPDSLNIEEAALLAGVINAPTKYNPVFNPKNALERRNIVLLQMYRYNFLTKVQYDTLVKKPIKLNYTLSNQNEGLAPYLREYLRMILTANYPERDQYNSFATYKRDSIEWFTNPLYGWVNKHKKPDGSTYNIYKDGLKIYTTINYNMQRYAEEAVREHLGGKLQAIFFAEKKGRAIAPYSWDLPAHIRKKLINHSVRNTDRYRKMAKNGISEDTIMKIFKKPVSMKIFTWRGERDTVMSPYDSLMYLKHILQVGFISMDPHNGHVKAYVGGPNYKYFKYDMAKIGKRQVGSTIKPFLYTLAMQEDYSPCYRVPNVSQTFQLADTTWTPKNAGKSKYDGEMVTLKWGLANSVNNISAWLIKQFNPGPVVDIMKKMGVTSDVAAVPSIFLGTSEITVAEMVGAYSTFANKGVYVTPIYVSRIEDRTGNVISQFYAQKKEAISEVTAYKMIKLLRGVVNAGTGFWLRTEHKIMADAGGKTGTTQNHSDGWFMGITPDLVSGAWVGFDERSIHFDRIEVGQGAAMALPIWAHYMKRVYNTPELNIKESAIFDKPSNYKDEEDCDDYKDKQDQEFEMLDIQF